MLALIDIFLVQLAANLKEGSLQVLRRKLTGRKRNAVCKGKMFPEFHSLQFGLVRVFHHFSEVCFGLCIFMVFTVLTSTVRKGGRERSFSFLCIWDDASFW